ncbi:hypothetical protein Tco_1311549 [Tanacetum coccineum]
MDKEELMMQIDGNDDEERIINVVEEEDREWIRFLGGNNSSGIEKYRGLNSSDGGNIGDRVKIAGGVIGFDDEIGVVVKKLEVKRRMPPKRTSTSEAPAMTQVAIRKLVVNNVATALEAQAVTMANAKIPIGTLEKEKLM